MILVEPRLYAVNVEVMTAGKEEYLLALHIHLQADSTHPIWILFHHCFDGYRPKYLFSDPILFLDFLRHVLIIDLLESMNIHPFNGRLLIVVVIYILILEHPLPLIVPVNEIQVVLTRRVHLHWHVLLYLRVEIKSFYDNLLGISAS